MNLLKRFAGRLPKKPPHPDLVIVSNAEAIEFWDGKNRAVFSIVSAAPVSKELALKVDEPVAGWLSPEEVRALIESLERLEQGLR